MDFKKIQLGSLVIVLTVSAIIVVLPYFIESEVLIRTVGSSATEGEIWYTNPYDYSSYFIGKTGTSGLGSLAKDDSGALYSINHEGQLVTIDINTGEATIVATVNGIEDISIRGLTFGPEGNLYAIQSDPTSDYSVDLLFIINPVDGSSSFIGDMSFVGIQALTTGPDGTIYGYDNGNFMNKAGFITVDTETGQATDVSNDDNEGGGWIQSLAFNSEGILYAVGGGGLSVDINPDNGEFSGIGGYISPSSGGIGSEFVYKLVPNILFHRHLLGALGIIWASEIIVLYLLRRRGLNS